MEPLNNKKCKPCSGETEALSPIEAQSMLKALPTWQLNEAGTALIKDYQFKNFHYTMSFVNALAYIANQENHHPDLTLGYNYCQITLTTHAIHGLSENDFILAAKIDQLSS